ncbi:hypothetical protein CHKEEEPN_4031 [Methylorubrum podarium]|nr:hypothetical protein CHKEEEPN_4031 [Methylorubrum podarium]
MPLTATITSPLRKPARPASEPSSTAVTATPSSGRSACSSSLTAGEVLTKVAPANGVRVRTLRLSRGRVSGAGPSLTGIVCRLLPRRMPRSAVPEMPFRA